MASRHGMFEAITSINDIELVLYIVLWKNYQLYIARLVASSSDIYQSHVKIYYFAKQSFDYGNITLLGVFEFVW